MAILVQDNIWLSKEQRHQKLKEEADEMGYAALALLLERDFTYAAKAIKEMAALYVEVYRNGALNYGRLGFDKKVKQIISIASDELNESNLKSQLDEELKRITKRSILILPT